MVTATLIETTTIVVTSAPVAIGTMKNIGIITAQTATIKAPAAAQAGYFRTGGI